MAMQQQNATFAGKLGARVAAAHAQHCDAPVSIGDKRLPAGIRGGIAKISGMYTKVQDRDEGKTPKGEPFFRAFATVLWPINHAGERVADQTTQLIIPLCDIPAKKFRGGGGESKAVSFEDNWFDFQNFFKWFGITPPNEHGRDAASSMRIEAYYLAAIKTLTDPQRPPLFVEFSTSGFTPPVPTGSPPGTKSEEIVKERWHGQASEEMMAKVRGQFTPGGGMTDNTSNGQVANPAAVQPDRYSEPPTGIAGRAPSANGTAEPAEVDTAEEVAALVDVAMDDPEGATDEGTDAHARLEDLAWQHGYSKEDTDGAADWAAIGDMILQAMASGASAPMPEVQHDAGPAVGDKHKFAKRTKDGSRLKNNKGEEFPPQEVEVVTVDHANKTCTVKSAKDGKPIMDIRTKEPYVAKWEWLE